MRKFYWIVFVAYFVFSFIIVQFSRDFFKPFLLILVAFGAYRLVKWDDYLTERGY